MAEAHPGATLTPEFRQFMPGWVARQPWYAGEGIPALRPVGFFRFEDPDGEVGIETHVLTDGNTVYQIPMTYRGSPLPGAADAALISVSEHSVLGTRWIYDATVDPVWRDALLRLVRSGGRAEPSAKDVTGPVTVSGLLVAAAGFDDELAVIDLRRVLTGHGPEDLARSAGADAAGIVYGTWRTRPEAAPATGILAVVRMEQVLAPSTREPWPPATTLSRPAEIQLPSTGPGQYRAGMY